MGYFNIRGWNELLSFSDIKKARILLGLPRNDTTLVSEFLQNPKIKNRIDDKLANDLNLPVVVHCREAYDDLYSTILKSKHTKGVIHCFSGDIDYAKKINKEEKTDYDECLSCQ